MLMLSLVSASLHLTTPCIPPHARFFSPRIIEMIREVLVRNEKAAQRDKRCKLVMQEPFRAGRRLACDADRELCVVNCTSGPHRPNNVQVMTEKMRFSECVVCRKEMNEQ